MATIQFYASPEDNAVLREKIDALGLHVYVGEFEAPNVLLKASPDQFHGFISFQNPDELP